MISVKDAESLILNLIEPLRELEEIELGHALGRILAREVHSNVDFPYWHNAAMDGYTLRIADLQKYPTLAFAPWEIPAGSSQPVLLGTGECMRIFTGGMLPQGADTVVMQEDVEVRGDRLKLNIIPKSGEYVRQKGEFYQAGTTLLPSGIKLNPPEIGILAATQNYRVQVYRQPRVSIISTGNELVTFNKLPNSLQSGQIIDSNQYVLSGLITQAGALPIPLGIVGDRPEDLEKIIQTALANSDLVISTGGVSVGDYDYVQQVLINLGAELHIQSCSIKPGKPLTVATFDRNHHRQIYFGLPGNPASTMVGFHRFIDGAIAKLSGANSQYWYPQYTKAIALADLHAQGRRETYLWGYLRWHGQSYHFQPVDNYSSGNLISWAGINGLAILKVNQTYVPKGEIVEAMIL